VEIGADMIELDVQELISGEVVVFHDFDLERLAHDPRELTDLNLEQVNNITIQSFKNKELKPQKIPLFADVLRSLDGRIQVDIELKTLAWRQTPLVVDTVRLVEKMGFTGRVMVSCFSYPQLIYVRRLDSAIRVGFLTDYPRGYLVLEPLIPKRWRPDVLVFNYIRLSLPIVEALRGRYQVYVFTVDRPADWQRMVDWGVDGIVTNRPEQLKKFLDEIFGQNEDNRP
jgi:glycerophosphoryl diester phosphodiesterase